MATRAADYLSNSGKFTFLLSEFHFLIYVTLLNLFLILFFIRVETENSHCVL